MDLGNSLFNARKRCGLSQEVVAEHLGVSRQTVSKWETCETLPDICQTKKMSKLYKISLDDLIDFDTDIQEVQDIIDRTREDINEKIDWNKAWGKKYPILLKYKDNVDITVFANKIEQMLNDLKTEYSLNEQDAMLVLKDILYNVWKARKKEFNDSKKNCS